MERSRENQVRVLSIGCSEMRMVLRSISQVILYETHSAKYYYKKKKRFLTRFENLIHYWELQLNPGDKPLGPWPLRGEEDTPLMHIMRQITEGRMLCLHMMQRQETGGASLSVVTIHCSDTDSRILAWTDPSVDILFDSSKTSNCRTVLLTAVTKWPWETVGLPSLHMFKPIVIT